MKLLIVVSTLAISVHLFGSQDLQVPTKSGATCRVVVSGIVIPKPTELVAPEKKGDHSPPFKQTYSKYIQFLQRDPLAQVPDGGLVVDAGGREAVAAQEMAQGKNIQILSISPGQDTLLLLPNVSVDHRDADVVLPTLKGKVALYLDIFGEMVNTRDHGKMFEDIYASLAEGGEAFIAWQHALIQSYVSVETDTRGEYLKRTVDDLRDFMPKLYPEIFEVYKTDSEKQRDIFPNHVIHIRKQAGVPTIDLNLHRRDQTWRYGRNQVTGKIEWVPTSHYYFKFVQDGRDTSAKKPVRPSLFHLPWIIWKSLTNQ